MKKHILLTLLVFSVSLVKGQDGDLTTQLKELQKSLQAGEHRYDALEKRIDDVLWYHRMGDAAFIDKVIIAGPPAKSKNPTAMGAANPLKFNAYIFILQFWDG